MSRETISKYGTSNVNYSDTPATYTATTYTAPVYTTTNYTTSFNAPLDVKSSRIETRTYLNENTNNIET